MEDTFIDTLMQKHNAAIQAKVEQQKKKEQKLIDKERAKEQAKAEKERAKSEADKAKIIEVQTKTTDLEALIDYKEIYKVACTGQWMIASEEIYVSDAGEGFEIEQKYFKWTGVSDRGLQDLFPVVKSVEDIKLLTRLMQNRGRVKESQMCAYRVPSTVFNYLKVSPIELVEGEPHWIFDTVLSSICGGKAENLDHFEKCIVHKWREPGNFLIPWIVLNDRGGTGKDLFVSTVLYNLLGPWCCRPNLPVKNVCGHFNSALLGTCIALINEKPEYSIDPEGLKGFANEPMVEIEKKGQDPFPAQNMLWGIIASNHSTGSVKLANEDSDRRFSIICGNRPLKDRVAEELKRRGIIPDCTIDQAEEWTKRIGQYEMRKHEEIGKWINSLVSKHGNCSVTKALHGADYDDVVGKQQSLHHEVFEKIFLQTIPPFDFIRTSILYDYYIHRAGNNKKTFNANTFHTEAEHWLSKNNTGIVRVKSATWNLQGITTNGITIAGRRTSTDVYVKQQIHGPTAKTFTSNDALYFHEEYGRKVWDVV